MVAVTTSNRRLLLGLSLAVSLFLCASAFPASIPFIQYRHQQQDTQEQRPNKQPEQQTTTQTPASNSVLNQDPLSTQTYDNDLRDQQQETSFSSSSQFESIHPDDDDDDEGTKITRPAPSLSASVTPSLPSSSSPSFSSSLSFPPSIPSSHSHQRHDFALFDRATSTSRDQILHQCTVHYLALLDSEISDRLLAQLSRLMMMLPVIGVETRAVIRTKVVQVVQQASQRLTSYNSIQRVIQTAVDDAGLLRTRDPEVKKTKGRKQGPWRIHYTDEDDGGPTIFEEDNNQEDSNNDGSPGEPESEDNEEGDDEDNNNIGRIENEEEEKEAFWFSLASHRTASSASPSSTSSQQQYEDRIDESQIPELVDVAMEAVLEYMAEVLTPSLVIHQLAEAIQTTLHDMSKTRKLRLPDHQRDKASLPDVINVLSQSPGNGHHGLGLLTDDWVWSGDLNGDDEEDGEEDSDPRGQDEDLWDKDMEVNQWDSTGRLFEDFQDNADEEMDLLGPATSSPSGSGRAREDKDDAWDMSDEDEDQDAFSIGIQDNTSGDQYDDDDGDEDLDTLEKYEQRERVRQRFQKRGMTPVLLKEEEPHIKAKRGLYPTVFLNRARRPGFAPDPRLENLLTQLMEPLLRSFIEEEFPASCKRVQSELMDGILWTLDHKESETSELDQLALLAELEF
ncbi:hypothetical protein CPC16_002308 [Podila verticillata]|nr:hypothetical protein CPC16_002308 [Podila verticillata]